MIDYPAVNQIGQTVITLNDSTVVFTQYTGT